ncbi:MAG: hypothetical protein DCF22_12470 [Leptolyngbya sp.]|nr:MAG: hypothetical protein DCF22_12470 [Leptolyngbya sp.]
MNVLHASAICMISLVTVTSGISIVQAMNFAAPKGFVATSIADAKIAKKANLHRQPIHTLLGSYEPPPDIGGPKRTGGSGGRYV